MDEQDPRPSEHSPEVPADAIPDVDPEVNPARFGAPLPPPAWSSAAPPVPPRRRGPRLVAVGTALAVVAGAAGAGFLLGRLDDHGHAEAGGPPSGYTGQAPNGRSGESPFGGTPFTEAGAEVYADGFKALRFDDGTDLGLSKKTEPSRVREALNQEK